MEDSATAGGTALTCGRGWIGRSRGCGLAAGVGRDEYRGQRWIAG